MELPKEEPTQEEITEWHHLQDILPGLKDREMLLRKKIFAARFPNPREGVNKFELAAGYIMRGQYKLERKIDEAMLFLHHKEIAEQGIDIGSLVKTENVYKLDTKAYKALPDDKRKVFEKILDIKPGSPTLEIVKVKDEQA